MATNRNNDTANPSESQLQRTFRWHIAQLEDPVMRKLGRTSDCDIIRTSLAFASYHTENCLVSAERVAKRTGFSLDTVKDHRTELLRLGWWTVNWRTGRQVCMRISFPGELSQDSGRQSLSEEPLTVASSYSLPTGEIVTKDLVTTDASQAKLVTEYSDAFQAPRNLGVTTSEPLEAAPDHYLRTCPKCKAGMDISIGFSGPSYWRCTKCDYYCI